MNNFHPGFATVAFAFALAGAAIHSFAQELYPSRSIEMIVPWGPGGGSDQTGRKIAKLLENELKVSLPVVNVPGATGNTSLIGGHTDLMYSPLGNVRGMVDGKQLHAIIVRNNSRIPEFKDVPTSRKLGYDVTLPQFRSIVVKAGTDPQRVKLIADALARVYADKEYVEFLKSVIASEGSYVPAKDAAAFMQGEFEAVRKVLSASGKN